MSKKEESKNEKTELIDAEKDNLLSPETEILKNENTELKNILNALPYPYLVVIPYKKSEAQGEELFFAIKGWMHHFKEKFNLVVVGDHEDFLDSLPKEIVTHIPHVCNTDNPPLDIVEKLQMVVTSFPERENLILANDDIYAVNDFDINDVCLLKCTGLLTETINAGELYKINRDRTLKVLKKEKLSVYDYGCHLPIFLNVECLLELIETFNMTKEAYLISSLYFNYFYRSRIPFKLNIATDNLKCGVYRENPNMNVIKDAFMKKIWINNSTAGWIPGLQRLLEEHYC